jgi:methylmalonyl-CoA mutase cobalamin-binding domain/chain
MSKNINLDTQKKKFLEFLLDGEMNAAVALSTEEMEKGISPVEFFEGCIAPALEDIGEKFENLDIFLPEMMIAARIVQRINDDVLTPRVKDSTGEQGGHRGKILIATVQGDLHDIGKNMVALMLRVNGFEVFDLGTNIPPAEIVAQAESNQVDIIGLSSLLTTCLPYMKDVFNQLEDKRKRDQFAIIMGGAAVTPEFAERVGADGFGHSAAEAVKLCKSIMQAQAS